MKRSVASIISLAVAALVIFVLAGCAEEPAAQSTVTLETVVTTAADEKPEKKDDFFISEITDEIFSRMKGLSFGDDCTLPREDLRYIHVLHVDADGVTHEGEMVCNEYIADNLLDIFRKLYEAKYPIERMRLVDDYGADDETSMRDDNSSSFNFRFISHTAKISKHGLGLAVDINPLYNPYVKTVNGERIFEPATAEVYSNRSLSFPYKLEKGDLCYELFTEHGFEWGGDWNGSTKDYQHFEMPDSVTSKLYG